MKTKQDLSQKVLSGKQFVKKINHAAKRFNKIYPYLLQFPFQVFVRGEPTMQRSKQSV